jgi:hypothetical protein
MNHGSGQHDPVRNAARALRLILSAVDRSDREMCVDAADRIFAEFDACPECRRAVMAHLATFGADIIADADRPLCERLAFLLDVAERHESDGTAQGHGA